MTAPAARDELDEILPLLCCPGCGADLARTAAGLACSGCGHRFDVTDGIPLLFWPNEWEAGTRTT